MKKKRFTIEVKGDTKSLFDSKKPRGTSADAFINILLEQYNSKDK